MANYPVDVLGCLNFSSGINVAAGSLEHEPRHFGEPHLVQRYQPHEGEARGQQHAREYLDPAKGMFNLDDVP